MKVLLVNTFIGYTSTGNLTYEIYKTNLQYGNECMIAYGRLDKKDCPNSYKISNKLDYTIHGIWTRITDLNGFASWHTTRKFLRFIDDYKPDIIHIHNLHGYYLNIKLFFDYIYNRNIPVVWTFHDCWPFTGHCPYYTNIGCERWKTECYSCPKKTQHPASYLMDNARFNYRMKKKLFTKISRMIITPVSKWLSNEVKQSFFKDMRIETVYNGVDLNIFKPVNGTFRNKNGLMRKKILLGVANNWVETKGLNDFIRMSSLLNENEIIVLVGLTKEQMNGLPSNIIALGKTSCVEELVDIYSSADVFVNPSREETFGLVTAEAMACGTPAVVYNATASPELVDERTGWVVEVGDIEGLYNATIKVNKNTMSNYCIERAKRLFDKKINQCKYLEIYRKLINEELIF